MHAMTFNNSCSSPVLPADAASLTAAIEGSVLLPGEAGYDDERAVWNLNHELKPAVIVVPKSSADVQAAVTFAARQQRPVLVKNTGHQMVGKAQGAVMIATNRMNDITIDTACRTARVGAGVLWSEVIAKAAKVGLAPLNGTNPTVGVAGYTLGGGLSPTLGRSHGYAADHVRSLDVVTADAKRRHVDAESEPDLFWALRGGKGNFAVVTALEFNLFPVSRLYAGGIYFPGERMAEVLRAWAAWHPGTPETMTTSIAVMRMPSLLEVPEPLRGKFLVSVRVAYNGTTADGERMVEPLRAVAPAVLDTVRDMPYSEVASIHNEPTDPLPYYERSIMLREFPTQAQDKLIELVGPDAETALVLAELRALGGGWDREPAVPNAVVTRGLPYSLLAVAAGPLSQEEQLKRSVAELLEGMRPWQADRRYVNNLAPDEAADAAAIYGPGCYERLASIKKAYDPTNMFRLNHNVVPAA
ncbi:FAD-binding oxidoreductase [Bradyrhizobium japonicum]|uniref:FAD-binding oxidoreductase n=1 Tax=Bradyrhizobium japonicum TaxID=375 RepID=UPI0004568028|nr:FAD-binding oxidoreductase [Bradyrhizobium japonicum]AHY49253.1 putative FAD-dependent oxygenase [Bradyrhizobium japonicum SEMIA 5079]MCD9112635.1 FAD-binding oxidoreductase [Bradyrhizobium japonicum]MCD9256930.1 FAD-binding oxidoreductase [Bradyrhizobium japonicum SEMIA 5079]MCD9822188.1 FAD-binding oxidoreductase [Bradyrhizobium japonicum]MCD9894208.1 FAD-binding oxidoreductase [Bradyrhizobium japonicum]